jgi:LysM repeat protein
MFGVNVAMLMKLNDLTGNDMLTVGQTLIIEK